MFSVLPPLLNDLENFPYYKELQEQTVQTWRRLTEILVPNKYEQMPRKVESTWIKYLSAGAHGIITPSIDLLGFQCSKQPHQETVTLKAHCDSFCQHRDLWCLHGKSPQPTIIAILPSHSECECYFQKKTPL